jgi:hypothetical protein
MRYYIVWLRNNTDIRDDEPVKIKAKSEREARDIASNYLCNRFTIRGIYTLKEFKEFDPWWHAHFWGQKAINERRSP